jgi:hypothetical protein
MLDVLYLAITVAFFAIAIGYVRGCEKLHGGAIDE